MNFWSEGLGDRELVMGLDRARSERRGEFILLTGVVDSPAPWEYEVKVQYDDWLAILRTATTKEACGFIAAKVSLGAIASMGVSIVKFVVLLAWYRAVRLLGLSRVGLPISEAPGEPAPKG